MAKNSPLDLYSELVKILGAILVKMKIQLKSNVFSSDFIQDPPTQNEHFSLKVNDSECSQTVYSTLHS